MFEEQVESEKQNKQERKSDLFDLEEHITEKSFQDFAEDAYASEDGMVVRYNPETGQTELFVAGTRNALDWYNNVAEADRRYFFKGGQIAHKYYGRYNFSNPFRSYFNHYENVDDSILYDFDYQQKYSAARRKKEKLIQDYVNKYNVDVVYGHSRGGAVIADTTLPSNVKKVGLDAAMMLAQNKDMDNIYSDDPFTKLISLSGKKNYNRFNKAFHQAWNN